MGGQTRVTNSQAAAHESWLVRHYPWAPKFSRNNPIFDREQYSDPTPIFIWTFIYI